MNADHPSIFCVDISDSPNGGLSTHRFCETDENQYNSDSTSNPWLWNFLWYGIKSFDAEAANSINQTEAQVDGYILASDTDDGAIAPASGSNGGFTAGEPLRPFHPTRDGHASIKSALIAAIQANGGADQAAASPSSSFASPASTTTTANPHPTCTEWTDCPPCGAGQCAECTAAGGQIGVCGCDPCSSG